MVRRQLSGDLKYAKKQTLSGLQYNLEQHKGSMEHSLRKGALALLDTTVMAVAGSAPAYSITASTAALVAAVGTAGPAALLITFLPMLGIAIAFSYFKLWRSDAGAAYAWVGRTIHPALGFIAGWALLSLSTIFMVAAALPAGESTLDLIAPGQLHDVLWATAIGAVWFLGVLALVTCGITATAKVQVVLTLLEVAALILVGGLAIWRSRMVPVAPFSGTGSCRPVSAPLIHFPPGCLSRSSIFSAGTCRPTSRKKQRMPTRPLVSAVSLAYS
jgi:amino acid transporter